MQLTSEITGDDSFPLALYGPGGLNALCASCRILWLIKITLSLAWIHIFWDMMKHSGMGTWLSALVETIKGPLHSCSTLVAG